MEVDDIKRTYNIPDELYDRTKKYADESYIDVTTVIKLALNEYLMRHTTDDCRDKIDKTEQEEI